MSEISRQEFQRRRQALVEQMQPGSAALIFAAPEVTRSADSEFGCRSGCRAKIPKALILRHFSLSDNHDNHVFNV